MTCRYLPGAWRGKARGCHQAWNVLNPPRRCHQALVISSPPRGHHTAQIILTPPTNSDGCAVGAWLWRSPKVVALVRGQYLDGWPLSRVLAGVSKRWTGGWTLRVERKAKFFEVLTKIGNSLYFLNRPRISCNKSQ